MARCIAIEDTSISFCTKKSVEKLCNFCIFTYCMLIKDKKMVLDSILIFLHQLFFHVFMVLQLGMRLYICSYNSLV